MDVYIVVIAVHRQYAKGVLLCSNGNSVSCCFHRDYSNTARTTNLQYARVLPCSSRNSVSSLRTSWSSLYSRSSRSSVGLFRAAKQWVPLLTTC
eukprot:16960-Heterococcus_DN1.PRE.1